MQNSKQQLVDVIHFFHEKGWCPATSSNFSFREQASSTICISVSGKDKGDFSIGDLMHVDYKGIATAQYANTKPSAETLLHTLLYEDQSVNAVLHTHSVNATVFSQLFSSQKKYVFSDYEILKGIKGVDTHKMDLELPIFDNNQDMEALSLEIKEAGANQNEAHAFLLAGHGLYAWGESIAEAKRHIEVFEFLFECEMKTWQLSN